MNASMARDIATPTSTRARSVIPYLQPFGHAVDFGDMGLIALPPADVNISVSNARSMINVMPDGGFTLDFVRLNGSAHRFDGCMLDRVSMLAGGYELELAGTKAGWELYVEFDVRAAEALVTEALDGAAPRFPSVSEYADRATSTLARLAIEQQGSAYPESLYLDGLTVAILARQLELAGQRGRGVSTSGTDRRIDRAVDFIRAYLHEPLSIGSLAAVAVMSPTWFSACFRARTGLAVHAWVIRCRLERARHLLRTDVRSIAEVALACGFSSQAHLTMRFGQAYGITPARWRGGA